jgi:hypothetical protein
LTSRPVQIGQFTRQKILDEEEEEEERENKKR